MVTNQRGNVLFLILVGLIILILGLAYDASQQESSRWEKFSAEHQCVIVGRRQVHHPKTTSSQTAYSCDDGVTYWRND